MPAGTPRTLYAAVKSSKPIDVAMAIDAFGNGWNNGKENYEIRATRAGEQGYALAISRYEARHSACRSRSP